MNKLKKELPLPSKVCEIIDNMPAIFYRYTFDGEKIIKTEIAKKYPNMDACSRRWNQTFEIRTVQPFNHRYSWLSSPWEIKFGEYDKRRKAVFLEEDDAELKAAEIFAKYYDKVWRTKQMEADFWMDKTNAIVLRYFPFASYG